MRRIGVAIAVPEPWGERLQAYRSSLGDDNASGIPTHITLVPPYDVGADGLDAVEQHLSEVSSLTPAFRVRLQGTGSFRPVSPVVFVALTEGAAECERLAAGVRTGPLYYDLEFPYHPHVTVAHHLEDDVLDRAQKEMSDFECDFEVDRLSLYVHRGSDGWVPTRDYPLTTG